MKELCISLNCSAVVSSANLVPSAGPSLQIVIVGPHQIGRKMIWRMLYPGIKQVFVFRQCSFKKEKEIVGLVFI